MEQVESNEPQIPLQFYPQQVGSKGKEVRGDDHDFLRLCSSGYRNKVSSKAIQLIDLFSGVGGISLGFHEAARHLGIDLVSSIAVDSDKEALDCFARNFDPAAALNTDLGSLLNRNFNGKLKPQERELEGMLTGANRVLVGGPPCQGHSDLNNSTRRSDPKNSLYGLMARAARVFQPEFVLIENVPTVVHDRGGIVEYTLEALQSENYVVSQHLFDLTKLGVPQRRRRHVLIASRSDVSEKLRLLEEQAIAQRNLFWAIGDLQGLNLRTNMIDIVATPNPTTKKRIDYLFDNDLFELPDSERPNCHRNKPHSYNSIYGRLSWEEPSQTITRGFYSMCMGRYVHPSERRTLSAREAARIQFFPDFFDFAGATSRTKLATLIGNAVPPKLGYSIGLELLSSLERR